MEEWKNIPNFEGIYEVSSLGNVRVCKTKHLKSQWENHRGYLHVTLIKNKKEYKFGTHRLVLMAFDRMPLPKEQCCHNDGNRKNNNINNLRWGSASENQKDREIHGTSNHGERNPQSKLTKNDVIAIREMYIDHTAKEISEIFNIKPGYVYSIIAKRTWKHV